jgi:uncharacterized membrane-anchored protein
MRLPYNLGPHTLSQDPRKKKKEKRKKKKSWVMLIVSSLFSLNITCLLAAILLVLSTL